MLAYNKLNEAIKCKIVEMYKELGYGSQNNISIQLDVSRRSVARVLKVSNINTARKNNYTLNESFFSDIINENQSYLLGIIYADGFNGGINHISIDLKDYEHLIKVANILEFTGNITDRTSGFDRPMHKLSFSSKEMSLDLKRYNVVVDKAYEVSSLPYIEKNLIRHFIRGYFDGDGCIYSTMSSTKGKNGKVYKYLKYEVNMIGNRAFLESIGKELSEIFITYTFKKSKHSQLEYIRISGGKNLRKLYIYMYDEATIYLDRKYNIYAHIKPR